MEIRTSRLRLIPLDLRSLRLLKESRHKLQKHLGLELSELQMSKEFQKEMAEALEWWIAQVKANPEHYPWYTNWEIVLTAENRSIGGIGLSGKPDKNGETMTGYLIDERYHHQGFASESLQAIIRWVFRDPAAKRLRADTPKENWASQQVLRKCGFKQVSDSEGLLHWALDREGLPNQDSRDPD